MLPDPLGGLPTPPISPKLLRPSRKAFLPLPALQEGLPYSSFLLDPSQIFGWASQPLPTLREGLPTLREGLPIPLTPFCRASRPFQSSGQTFCQLCMLPGDFTSTFVNFYCSRENFLQLPSTLHGSGRYLVNFCQLFVQV